MTSVSLNRHGKYNDDYPWTSLPYDSFVGYHTSPDDDPLLREVECDAYFDDSDYMDQMIAAYYDYLTERYLDAIGSTQTIADYWGSVTAYEESLASGDSY